MNVDTETLRALVKAAREASEGSSIDEEISYLQSALDEALGLLGFEENLPEVSHEFVALNIPAGLNNDESGDFRSICLFPAKQGLEWGWSLYIPPTTEDAFIVPEGAEFNPENNRVIDNLNYTWWPTLTGAVTSLSLAVKMGLVQFNDGRVAT